MAPRAAARATAEVSEPPRPRVVISGVPAAPELVPWKPATTTTKPSANRRWSRSVRISRMRARPWADSVMMPAWVPVIDTAGTPWDWRAMASRAIDTCSPVASSMSISRWGGLAVMAEARPVSSSVVWPMADTTITRSFPSSRQRAMRWATAWIRATSATEVPPNF